MRIVPTVWSHPFLMLPHRGWIPFWEEIFRREIADEFLQDPSYGDVTYRVDYGGHGIVVITGIDSAQVLDQAIEAAP